MSVDNVTPATELTTFENLEKAVRTHCLEEVGPKKGLFLSSKPQEPIKAEND